MMSLAGAAGAPKQQPPAQAEHKLQYFDLDVTNKPYSQGGNGASGMRLAGVDTGGARANTAAFRPRPL